MGLFDSVYADCPRCGKRTEFQTKADEDPYMSSYTLETAPTHLLIDVLNDPHYCSACKAWFALVDPAFPPGNPPRPDPKAVPVRDPADGEARLYQDGSFGWWDAPFTFADLAQGTSAFGHDPQGREAKPAGPVAESDAPNAKRQSHPPIARKAK